jgi:chromosome segregation ATPase
MKRSHEEIKGKLNKAQDENLRLKSSLKSSKAMMLELAKESAVQQEANDKLKSSQAAAAIEHAKLLAQIHTLKEELSHAKEGLDEETARSTKLAGEIGQCNTKLGAAEVLGKVLTTNLTLSQGELAGQKKAAVKAQQELQQCLTHGKTNTSVSELLANLTEAKVQLSAEKAKSEEMMTEMKQAESDHSTTSSTLKLLQANLTVVAGDLAAEKARNAKLKSDMAEVVEGHGAANESIKELRASVVSQNADLAAEKAKTKAVTKELAALQLKRDSEMDAQKDCQAQLQSIENRTVQLNANVSSMSEMLTSEKEKTVQLRQEKSQCNEAVKELTSHHGVLILKNSDLRRNLTAALVHLSQERNKTLSLSNNLTTHIEKHDVIVNNLVSQVQDLTAKNEENTKTEDNVRGEGNNKGWFGAQPAGSGGGSSSAADTQGARSASSAKFFAGPADSSDSGNEGFFGAQPAGSEGSSSGSDGSSSGSDGGSSSSADTQGARPVKFFAALADSADSGNFFGPKLD